MTARGRLDQAAAASRGLRRRLVGSVTPAAVGCALGFLYGQRFGDLGDAAPGLYATLGAVVGILVVRVGAILWMILRDYVRND